ncbi:MAG: metal ABC transporter permease [Gammaproteobacteria bacterium]|jgi:zinc transport system permease protein
MSAFPAALLSQPFLQHALLAGILASIGCGLIGSYVYVKRITFLAGGVAHAVLGGMGVAYFLGSAPLGGALVAALIAALLIGWVTLRWQQYEDTLIGALWAVGMAIGVVFISRTPGYNIDLMSFLFGNILMVSGSQLWMMAAVDVVIALVVGVFYKQFLAVCFDQEFARLRGVPVDFFYLLLLCMVALTVVLLIQIVGLILVIALLTLPAATAALFLDSLLGIMAAATVLGMVFTGGGLALSYGPDLPTGATIILLAAAVYFVAMGGWAIRRRLRRQPSVP